MKADSDIHSIGKIVREFYGLSEEAFQAKTRKREIVQARQIAMYFSKQRTKASLAAIGREIGNKDHATVLHACRTVASLKETYRQIREDMEEIEKKINRIVKIKSRFLTDDEISELIKQALINKFHNC